MSSPLQRLASLTEVAENTRSVAVFSSCEQEAAVAELTVPGFNRRRHWLCCPSCVWYMHVEPVYDAPVVNAHHVQRHCTNEVLLTSERRPTRSVFRALLRVMAATTNIVLWLHHEAASRHSHIDCLLVLSEPRHLYLPYRRLSLKPDTMPD